MGKHEFVYRSTSSPEEIRSRIKAKSTYIKKRLAYLQGYYYTEGGDMIKLYNGTNSTVIDTVGGGEICLSITIKPDDSGAIVRCEFDWARDKWAVPMIFFPTFVVSGLFTLGQNRILGALYLLISISIGVLLWSFQYSRYRKSSPQTIAFLENCLGNFERIDPEQPEQ